MIADHLSRIPNAPIIQDPINEDFQDEHILAIFKEPWYAEILNYLATGQLPADWTKQDQCRLFAQVWCFFWEELYLFKIVLTRLFDDAYQKKNRGVCLVFAMNLHAEDTSVPVKPYRKFYKVSFTGPLCSKTHSTFASHVQIIKKLGKFREET